MRFWMTLRKHFLGALCALCKSSLIIHRILEGAVLALYMKLLIRNSFYELLISFKLVKTRFDRLFEAFLEAIWDANLVG